MKFTGKLANVVGIQNLTINIAVTYKMHAYKIRISVILKENAFLKLYN